MHSVLRPPRRPKSQGGDVSFATRPKRPRRRRTWKRNLAVIVFSAGALWLVGGLAWWPLQRWQDARHDTAETDEGPTHRTTMDAPPLRR